jgi:hypothetical protein
VKREKEPSDWKGKGGEKVTRQKGGEAGWERK